MADAPYVDEFEALIERFPNFRCQLVLSDVPAASAEAVSQATGMVHEVAQLALLRLEPRPESCDFYVCGPPAMLAATRAMLKQLRVDEARVAFDDFKI